MALKSCAILLAFIQIWSANFATGQKDLDDAVALFAKNLFRQISALNEDENFVVSPIAIQRQLLLIMQAAHGTTYEEIQKAINTDGVDELTYVDVFAKKPPEFSCNDNIYLSSKVQIRLPFKQIAKLWFEVTLEVVNFDDLEEIAGQITSDAESVSHGLIKKMIRTQDLTVSTPICFINNVLFASQWKSPFPKKGLRVSKFFDYGKYESYVKAFYSVKKLGFAELNDLKAKAISLPYKHSDEKLLILLPEARNDVKGLLERVLRTDFSLLLRRLKLTLVALTLPQFSIDYRVEPLKLLPKLGANDYFTHIADFENAFENPQPSDTPCAFSKSHFDVGEHGSSVEESILDSSVNEYATPEVILLVEHPFLFFIHNNETAHFFGRVVAPNKQTYDQSEEVTTSTTAPDDYSDEE